MKSNSIIIILGPTAVGKTDFSLEIAHKVPTEIVNCDVGQMYTPLTIGVAKPNWRASSVPHHLFDILDEPCNFTVTAYRELLLTTIEGIWKRGNVPVIVGGASFYVKSLFFPPLEQAAPDIVYEEVDSLEDYSSAGFEELRRLDPERAAQIHPHDRYRIARALALARSGLKPSTLQPVYNPPAPFVMAFLTRERKELYDRINLRVRMMAEEGLVKEVKALLGTPWEPFLREKKMIGYAEIFDYLEGTVDLETALDTIAQRTRHYAKRQLTFWRMLERQMGDALVTSDVKGKTMLFNLTLSPSDLYIDQLLQEIL